MMLYNPPPASTINIYTPTIEGSVSSNPSVTTTYANITETRVNRAGITIWNKGSNRVIISYGDAADLDAATDEGAFPLDAGGIFVDDYPSYQGIYRAKTVSGTSMLSIKELVDTNYPV